MDECQAVKTFHSSANLIDWDQHESAEDDEADRYLTLLEIGSGFESCPYLRSAPNLLH